MLHHLALRCGLEVVQGESEIDEVELFLVVAQGLADPLDDFGALVEAAQLPFGESLANNFFFILLIILKSNFINRLLLCYYKRKTAEPIGAENFRIRYP